MADCDQVADELTGTKKAEDVCRAVLHCTLRSEVRFNPVIKSSRRGEICVACACGCGYGCGCEHEEESVIESVIESMEGLLS